jgi:hypothetical protein
LVAFGLALSSGQMRSWPLMLFVGLAVMVGVLGSLPQLRQVLAYSKFSHRQGAPTEEGYKAYVGSALQSYDLATLAVPTANGNPREWAVLDQGKAPSYWPAIARPGANFAESAVSIGGIILTLLFLVPWRTKAVAPIAVVGILSLLLAIGTPLNRLLYFYFPGWSASGSPGRIEALFVMCACTLASLAVRPRDGEWKQDRTLLRNGAFALGLMVLCTIPLRGSIPEGPNRAIVILIASATLPIRELALTIILSGGALYLAGRAKTQGQKALLIVLPCLQACLWCLNFVPSGAPLEKLQGDPNQRIAVINKGWGLLETPHALLPPNLASLSRIHELGGYDSLLHRDTVQYLRQVNGQDAAPPENGNMMLIKPTAIPAKLAEAGVTEIWSHDPAGIVQKKALTGPGRASIEKGVASITEETYSSLTVKTDGAGLLTLRDRNLGGWTAQVDGRDTPILPGFWRTVNVPAGAHTVLFQYHSGGTPWLEMGALFVAVLLFFIPFKSLPIAERHNS